MNKLAFLPFFLLLFFSVKAQDRIITIQRDTIHCTIVTTHSDRIYYEIRNNDGSITGKSIPLSQVSKYTAAPQSEQKSKKNTQQTSESDNSVKTRIRFGLGAGYSTMPWYIDRYKTSSPLPDYYNKLKSGMHINASVHYMLSDAFGVGMEYSFFKSFASGSLPIEIYPSVFLMGSEKYHQYVNYLGTSFLFRQALDEKGKFVLSESLSLGAIYLRMECQGMYPNINQSEYTSIISNTLLTGSSISGKFGLMAEYGLLKSVSVGLGGDIIWGSLKKVNIKSKGSNNYSNSDSNETLLEAMKLSRIDCSFVLHYYF